MNAAHTEAEQQIRQIVEDWFDAESRRDLDATMGFIAKDAVLQAPGLPQIQGEGAIRDFFVAFFGLPFASTGGETERVDVSESGDMAYGLGPNRVVTKGPDGRDVTEVGKWFIVWRKQRGSWKAVAASWSGDGAATSA